MLNELEAISKNIVSGSIISAYHELTESPNIGILLVSVREARGFADQIFQISSKEFFLQESMKDHRGVDSSASEIFASEARLVLNLLASAKNEVSNKLALVGGPLLGFTKEVLGQTYGFLLASTENEVKDMVTDFIRRIENNEIEISVDFDAPRNKYGQLEDLLDAKGNISFIDREGEKPMLRVRSSIIIDMISSPHYNIVYALLAAFDSVCYFDGKDQHRGTYTMNTVKRIVRNAAQERYDIALPPFLTWYLRVSGGN